MKLRLLAQGLTGLGIASLTAFMATATINQPGYAQGTVFYCGKSKGVPVTFARTQDGKNVPMVRWVSNGYFPALWTPEKRCVEVSRRFQKNYDSGRLKNIITGVLKGEPVVCAANNQISSCTDSTLLFTLKRGSDPNEIVRRLFDRRGLAAGNVLNESGGSTINIDVDAYIKHATVDTDGGGSTAQPEDSTSEAGRP